MLFPLEFKEPRKHNSNILIDHYDISYIHHVIKKGSNVFRIGLKSGKEFTIAAEGDTTEDQWGKMYEKIVLSINEILIQDKRYKDINF